MLYHQYHCACCEKVLTAEDKECPECGSHNIRSPYGLWVFCIAASLVVALVFQIVQVYFHDHQDTPTQQTLLQVLNQDRSTN